MRDALACSQQSQVLMPYFNTAIEFIHGALKKGGRVLVHCAMGQSRWAATPPCDMCHTLRFVTCAAACAAVLLTRVFVGAGLPAL